MIDDKQEYNAVTRQWEKKRRIVEVSEKLSEPHGRTHFYLKCPWCGSIAQCFCWSFRSVGKKCQCGALHLTSGYSIIRVKR